LRAADCPTLDTNSAHALEVVLSLETVLPQVEVTLHPVQGLTGLHGVNDPGPSSPVLVTGNALVTQEVIMALLSTTTAPFHVLFVDSLGHTVDMAVLYGTFTSKRVVEALESSRWDSPAGSRELILPGLAAALRQEVEARTGWRVRVGPICIGELPLFLGGYWSPPKGGEGKAPHG
jgi:acetyl-CoA decarbonylase/synthase complex subunit gamma